MAVTITNRLNTPGGSAGVSEAYSKIFHVQDQKSTGTNGGTLTAGARRTHDVNTPITNDLDGASLNPLTGVMTFEDVGDYYGTAVLSIFNSSVTQAWMRDVTNGEDLGQSINEYNIGSVGTSGMIVNFEFSVVDDPISLELQVESLATSAATGFGIPANNGTTEVYADIRIFKKEVA